MMRAYSVDLPYDATDERIEIDAAAMIAAAKEDGAITSHKLINHAGAIGSKTLSKDGFCVRAVRWFDVGIGKMRHELQMVAEVK